MTHLALITTLGFTPQANTANRYSKDYNGYRVVVDCERECFDYGDKITADSQTTHNFSQAENWVVLECVDRLLEKGYKPEDITLEKVYRSGHGHSGRLDILVKKDGRAFLMIECKTWGKEYNKERANIQKDGGQLLTYFQHDTQADYLLLYASKLDDTTGTIKTQQSIIQIEPHYRDAGNVADVFERWNGLLFDNGIFEPWASAYHFTSKRLSKGVLVPLDEQASTALFHQFLSILRKHSVSDKPNAFNVIFDLFLAKLWDEKKEDDEEMAFQWREGEDDAVSFQYRLLDLYRDGMHDFLRKEVVGLVDSDFAHIAEQSKIDALKKKVLMLERVFSIKSVIDEDSFIDNNRVLKEVVQLLQGYKIRYPHKQQHLSDFFERLLTTGLKQEAGQFFTPPPITRFIIQSLPLVESLSEHINQKTPTLPAVIDYAVGSGHFLTEVMEAYQGIINRLDIKDFRTDAKKKVMAWRADEYDWAAQYIYGVEKDYRLVKVAKVGCYFYGDGLAQIIHGDGLDSFASPNYRGLLADNADKPQFQFVLSNPPYAVSAFKTTLKAAAASQDFALFDSLSDRSSEIECLFIERTAKLLKTNGIAAIILPSSILSNSGIYRQARQIIFSAFELAAVVELGSHTFMATGTNTVILFLKRRDDSQLAALDTSLDLFFSHHNDIAIHGIANPIAKYIAHVWSGLNHADYVSLLQGTPSPALQNHELYKEYHSKINSQDAIIALERDKLRAFILAYRQQVVVIKTGQKAAEKQFLGYEFSNRRGNEGMHPTVRGKTVDECTHLYDINNQENPNKASSYIYKALAQGDYNADIPANLQDNVGYQHLPDMLTFDRADFEQTLSLVAKKKVKIDSKWEVVRLGALMRIARGASPRPIKQYLTNDDDGVNWIKIGDVSPQSKYITQTKEKVTKAGADKSRPVKKGDFILSNSMSFGRPYILDIDGCIHDGWLLLSDFSVKVNKNYLYQILSASTVQSQFFNQASGGTTVDNLNIDKVSQIKIPLPPLEVQEKIIADIAVLEKQEVQAQGQIADLRQAIFAKISAYPLDKVSTLCTLSKSKTKPQDSPEQTFIYLGLEHIDSDTGKLVKRNEEHGSNILSTKNVFAHGDILYGRLRPYLNKVFMPNFDGICSTDILVLKTDVPLLLKYALLSGDFVAQAQSMMKGISLPRIGIKEFLNCKIPLPPIAEQQRIVAEIEAIEQQIAALEQQLAQLPAQKKAVLTQYL